MRSHALLGRLFWGRLLTVSLGAAPRLYLLGLLLGLGGRQLWLLLLVGVPGLIALCGVGVPLLIDAELAAPVLGESGERDRRRLARLLELPRRLEIALLVVLVVSDLVIAGAGCLAFGLSLGRALPSAAVLALPDALLTLPYLLWVEHQLRPLAIEAMQGERAGPLPWSGPYWRRLRWHLPYTLALVIGCSLLLPSAILWRKGGDAVALLERDLAALHVAGGAALVDDHLQALVAECAVAFLLLGAFLVGSAVVFARQLAGQIARGAEDVRRSIELMAAGTYDPPAWISTDELGGLALATAGAFQRLDELAGRLRESADGLERFSRVVGEDWARQDELLRQQEGELRRAQVTVGEMVEASRLAAEKAQAVLSMADSAEGIRRAGEQAAARGLQELEAIGAQVALMQERIRAFAARARRISTITESVEALATQSRRLALNATAEAARVGEHGVRFGIIARQLRAHAEQSLASTRRVRAQLRETLLAIEQVVELSQSGARDVEASLRQARDSGGSLKALSGLMGQSVTAAQRISEAVARQSSDLPRLARAVTDLVRVLDEVLGRLGEAARVTRHVDVVAQAVRAALRDRGLRGGASRPAPGADGAEAAGRELVQSLLRGQQFTLLGGLVPLVYLVSVILGLESAQAWNAAWTVLPAFGIVSGLVVPRVVCQRLVDWALARVPGEAPGRRLARILELPRRQEVLYLLARLAAYAGFALVCCAKYARPVWWALPCTAVLTLLSAFASITHLLRAEGLVRPFALEELRRDPTVRLPWRGPFWRGLRWYLPYLVTLSITCTLAIVSVVLWREGAATARRLVEALAPWRGAGDAVWARLDALAGEVAVAGAVLGSFLLVCAMLAAGWMARQISDGAREVQETLGEIAAGRPRAPAWISTDELGSLSEATAAVFLELERFAWRLREAGGQLAGAAAELSASRAKLDRLLTDEVAALGEARGTADEIKAASRQAAQEAGAVLGIAEGGESIHRSGEAAVARSVSELAVIRERVAVMERRLHELEADTRVIGSITQSVEELAGESKMLALNASIEAVRSSAGGRTFGVIAKESQALASRSRLATQEVGAIVSDLSGALAETERSLGVDARNVDSSLERMRDSSAKLGELFAMLQECSGVARQIAAAVRQQDAGIAEISRAVGKVAQGVKQLADQLSASGRLTADVTQVAEQVKTVIEENAEARGR